jgi:5,10-methenyltetrahydromethanopterin hydrogenase
MHTKSASVTSETIDAMKRGAISAFNHTIPTTFFYNAHEKPWLGGFV